MAKNGTYRWNALHITHILESNPNKVKMICLVCRIYVLRITMVLRTSIKVAHWKPVDTSVDLSTSNSIHLSVPQSYLHDLFLINPGLKFNSVDTKVPSLKARINSHWFVYFVVYAKKPARKFKLLTYPRIKSDFLSCI